MLEVKRYSVATGAMAETFGQDGKPTGEWVSAKDFDRQVSLNLDYQQIEKELREEIDELRTICAQAYQVVGVLADEAGRFGTTADPGRKLEKALDNLSNHKMMHKDVLPFPQIDSKATDRLYELQQFESDVEAEVYGFLGYGDDGVTGTPNVLRAVKLMHEEVTRLRSFGILADANRFAWWFSWESKPAGILNEYLRGMKERWTLDQWRELIDRASLGQLTARKGLANDTLSAGGQKGKSVFRTLIGALGYVAFACLALASLGAVVKYADRHNWKAPSEIVWSSQG